MFTLRRFPQVNKKKHKKYLSKLLDSCRNPKRCSVALLKANLFRNYLLSRTLNGGFCGLEVACCPLVPKSAASNPTEAFGFFWAKKTLSTPSFGEEVKPSVPCRRLTTYKRSLNVTWKSGIFRQNSSAISRQSSSSFHY